MSPAAPGPPATVAEPARPLDGLVVIDLGQIYNGPYATLLLALGGADVIKVEPPRGDLLRLRGSRIRGALYPFCALNSNKRGVTIDLKLDAGRELLLEMIEAADVLVENFRPGVMERLGLGPERTLEVNPRLIHASGSGFGGSGPYRDYPAMDITVQAISGAMSVTGWPDRPPVKAGPAIADFAGGIHLYAAIVTALYERERTGRGGTVEAAMHEAVFPSLMSSLGLFFGSEGESIPLRTGNRHNGLAEAPYNVYETADGFLALICVSDTHWDNLLEALGREELREDERFTSMAARVAHVDDVDAVVEAYARERSTGELCEHLRSHGVPCAPVKDLDEVVADPHLHARGMLQEIEHPQMGPITAFSSPLRYGEAPAPALRPSPLLGQHNREVLCGWLGVDEERYAELEAAGALGGAGEVDG
ncbi:MAG: CoA transferase [Actinobacteria bacterium]|nr:CoA transferase [Actinomycetota bacterium]